jgi:hypothetical protein
MIFYGCSEPPGAGDRVILQRLAVMEHFMRAQGCRAVVGEVRITGWLAETCIIAAGWGYRLCLN